MSQFLSVWTSLNLRKRAIVVLATIAMFAAVLGLSKMATRPGMALLYAGIEEGSAGEIIRSLEQQGVTYEIRGDTIYVDSTRRDELRLTLAGDGLPARTNKGYELLDTLSGFGTTSQMFDAAYWRAKEGELARTIASSPLIRQARVYISSPASQSFRREVTPTASVTVTPSAGSIGRNHAKALRYLVASAVPGLAAEEVTVIDGQNGQVIGADENGQSMIGADSLADTLKQKVERLLEARVGYGNAVVEISVETEKNQESIVEKRFDPDTRVIISTDTEERTTSSRGPSNAPVTVASNLPEGDNAEGGGSNSQNSETRERVNYEVSETRREIVRSPGAIKRLTVAVLIDGTQAQGETGELTYQARSAEELATLTALVAAAVGFDEARGDVIRLESMPFKPIAAIGTPYTPSLIQKAGLNPERMLQLAVLAVVSVVLGLFVIRPMFAGRTLPARSSLPSPDGTSQQAAEMIDITSPTTPGTNVTGEEPVASASLPSPPPGDAPAPQLTMIGQPPSAPATSDPVARLRQLISDREEETVEVIRNWMDDPMETP